MAAAVASQAAVAEQPAFVFTEDNFRAPKLPANLKVVDVPLVEATDEATRALRALSDAPGGPEATMEAGGIRPLVAMITADCEVSRAHAVDHPPGRFARSGRVRLLLL